NEGKNLWAGLEDYLLDKAADERRRLTVFTGPVFAANDPEFRGVRIPRQFWKVAVVARPGRKLAALGFVVSQAELIRPVVEEAAIDVARTYQTSIRQIETLTGLDFGPLRNVDVGSVESFALEAAGGLRELNEFADIRLPGSAGGTPGVFDGRTTPFGANGAAEVAGTELSYYLLAYAENGRA